ncbi:MAG TPA: carboxypeptidase regulatory-like domain-containing protein [Gemmatimonadales bacterium]|nr:carboxypeptidase regulatory-like domain-containing protein [Gemmatimonadales bacterium]
MKRLVWSVCVLTAVVVVWPAQAALAQGVASAAVAGRVTDDAGTPVPDAQLALINTATGQRYATRSATDGRYFLENVQPGGPYSAEARALGFELVRVTGISLSLGQRFSLDLTMKRAAVEVAGVTVEARNDPLTSPARTGAGQFISDSLVRRLPSLTRNFTDFVDAVPQVSRSSAAGQNNRFNNIQIDGAVNNDLFNLGSTQGQPGGQVNAKAITLEAISQYQVLIAPFDVRQGGFAGGLINAVTKRGENEFHGTAFFDHQDDALVGNSLSGLPFGTFNQNQFGGSFGGPIIKDRLHFFLAAEHQARTAPDAGPDIGVDPVRATGISPDSAQRFVTILQSKAYPVSAGTFGQQTQPTPNTNLFGRLDWQASQNNIVTIRYNHLDGTDLSVGRGSFYSFSSNGVDRQNHTNSVVAQLNSTIRSRLFNELIVQYQNIHDERNPTSSFPQVQVATKSDTGGGFAGPTRTLVAGAEQFSQANRLDQKIVEVTDNLTFAAGGTHKVTVGTHNEFFRFQNLFLAQSIGLWNFTSLANLDGGIASSFARVLPYPGTTRPVADFHVQQFGVYLQDQWQATPRLDITYGLRMDLPRLPDQPRYNPTADSVFQIDTRQVPSGNVLWSPRVGFNYDATGDRSTVIRGGAGLFSGRPAYVWLSNAYGNSGRESVTLTCANRTATDSVPAFTLDPNNQPTACKNQSSVSSSALMTVNYFDKSFKFPQVWKFDVGVDHELPRGVLGTFEALLSVSSSTLLMRDRNIGSVASYTVGGRPLYGTYASNGTPTTNFVDTRFDKVLEHYNGSGDWGMSFTWQLQKRFGNGFEATGAYSYQHVVDRVSLTSDIATSNYAFDPIRYDPNDPESGRSAFDIPHKVTLTGTVNLPSGFQFSAMYVGRSGTPYSYVYAGDANADGYPNRSASVRGENDLVYVPRSRSDILLQNAADWTALDSYIQNEPCLNQSRGTIVKRYACSPPWREFLNVRLTGTLPTLHGHHAEAILEIFNFLNLVNRNWGLQRDPVTSSASGPDLELLRLVGWDTATNQGIYTFTNPLKDRPNDSASRWHMQLGMKYTF